ncbi:GntR family transcriptional regulator [Longivirga aurantiaca]|uniref:GntR family transcriptional regulator n=1 Tax=Longivirga aurantiaca TaxID=1837743 RepID=A0ABW1SVC5_9ACTN
MVRQTSSLSRNVAPAQRLGARVYEQVKSQILSGYYAPGEWLPVDDLCRTFGVSRQPVMESMRRLSGDWLVQIVPQVGCRVAQYDQQALVDYIRTVGDLEGEVAALAATRRTSEQLEDLAAITRELQEVTSFGDETRQLTRDYHGLVLEMAHSEVLQQVCEQLWDLGDFAWGIILASGTPAPHADGEERDHITRLSAAIEAQDPELARSAAKEWLIADLAPSPR